MKKIVTAIILVCMMLSMAACGGSPAVDTPPAEESSAVESSAVESTPAPAAEAEYKLGMGVVVSTDSSSENKAQVDATVATVVTDENGTIVLCRLDCAQSKMDVTGGAVEADKTFLTKRELREDYNMVKFSDATLEWYEQAENFETYCVGKTIDEIKNLETTVTEEGHTVAVDETLFASCSISIKDFIDCVVKAGNDEKGQTFKTADEFTLGLAAITNAADSTPATDADPAVVKMYTEFGATVVGADGKILAAITDCIQPVIKADKDGQIVETSFKGTKRELGPDYGMVAYGNAIAEWDAQAQAFADYCVGKTAAEVRAIETTENDHGYSVPADETLYASCTMQITGMMAVLAQAADYAR